MISFRHTWRLTLGCVLVVAQAGILALGLFHPRTSPGFRAYFIDRTVPLVGEWWPGPAEVPETAIRPRLMTPPEAPPHLVLTDLPPRG
jgi:hypothetical protein